VEYNTWFILRNVPRLWSPRFVDHSADLWRATRVWSGALTKDIGRVTSSAVEGWCPAGYAAFRH